MYDGQTAQSLYFFAKITEKSTFPTLFEQYCRIITVCGKYIRLFACNKKA